MAWSPWMKVLEPRKRTVDVEGREKAYKKFATIASEGYLIYTSDLLGNLRWSVLLAASLLLKVESLQQSRREGWAGGHKVFN